MNIKELKGVLERLETVYAAAGAAGPSKDLKSIIRILDGHGDKSVEAFVAETKALLQTAESGSSSPAVSADVIDEHASRLLAAGTDQAKFEKALAAVDSDARADKAAWVEIANRYLNEPSGETHAYKFRTVKEARSAMRDAFVGRFEAGGKQGIIKRLTQWAS